MGQQDSGGGKYGRDKENIDGRSSNQTSRPTSSPGVTRSTKGTARAPTMRAQSAHVRNRHTNNQIRNRNRKQHGNSDAQLRARSAQPQRHQSRSQHSRDFS